MEINNLRGHLGLMGMAHSPAGGSAAQHAPWSRSGARMAGAWMAGRARLRLSCRAHMVARTPPIELMAMIESICCCMSLWLWGISPGGVSPQKRKGYQLKAGATMLPQRSCCPYGGGGGPTDTRRRW